VNVAKDSYKEKFANDDVVIRLTKEETLQYVNDQAQRLFGMSSAEALRQLDEGKFRGTLKEAKLSLLRGLVEGLR
jgi:hypothetical protein